MIATVRLYYNTGLTVSNCLDTVLSLQSIGFQYRDFANIAIKQDRGRIDIRINTVYDNVKDADYCKINNVCYWVTSVNMLNDNVAEVKLQQDYITTVGITGLSVVSGWCTRRHVLTDNLYANVIDEPFTPTSKLEIDKGKEISGGSSTGFEYVVLSSVDLLSITNTAEAYFDSAQDKILVPKLPIVNSSSTTYNSNLVSPQKSAHIALTCAFDPSDANVQSGITAVRQLGVESCIGAAYMLPKAWASVTKSGGLITSITDQHQQVTSDFGGTWGSYKNAKVYSGQFQKIQCFSMCTGDKSTNRVEDIVDRSSSIITWLTFADTRYSGAPGCKPKYFHNTLNSAQFEVVTGANWQQTPFCYNNSSGFGFAAQNAELSGIKNLLNYGNNSANGLLDIANIFGSTAEYYGSNDGNLDAGVLGGITSGGHSLIGLGQNYSNWTFNKKQIFGNLNQNMMNGAEDVKFPQNPMMSDYINNNFYEIRYRLSDNDMQRFDDFLSAYGYAVDEQLTEQCFIGRTNHNYVKAYDVTLKKSGCPQYLLNGAAEQIEAGVRIWHTAPSRSALLDNPI